SKVRCGIVYPRLHVRNDVGGGRPDVETLIGNASRRARSIGEVCSGKPAWNCPGNRTEMTIMPGSIARLRIGASVTCSQSFAPINEHAVETEIRIHNGMLARVRLEYDA